MKASTLAELVSPAAIGFDELHRKYKPMLGLVNELIGVVPNCDPALEIWPTGFRTYNLLVPNLLNLPQTLWMRKRFKATMGLAMYAASMAAGCPYCSAHTCAFALRRGAAQKAITGERSPAEAAAIAVAERLGRIPSDLTAEHCRELEKHFSPSEMEQIVASVCMMGFLNKFMDAMGIELEAESVAMVGKLLAGSGWDPRRHIRGQYIVPEEVAEAGQDNFLAYLRVLRYAPGAIRLESSWTKGVPDSYPEVGSFLKRHTGHSFPMLEKLKKKRQARALATVLRDNLDPSKTRTGLKIKCLASLVFATVAGNSTLAEEARIIAGRFSPELSEADFQLVQMIALHDTPSDPDAHRQFAGSLPAVDFLTKKELAALMLAKAASTSPAKVSDEVISETAENLEAPEIIELMVWVSVQQMLHRLYTFYSVAG